MTRTRPTATKGRACTGKARHNTEQDAAHALRALVARGANRNRLSTYHCPHCDGWHVGHTTPEEEVTTTAVTALREIREQWGDLLAAIGRPPAAEWPPRAHHAQPDTRNPDPDAPAVGRLPLTLRQHPAPLNVDALDAAMAIEGALFDLADRIAAAHQSTTVGRDSPDRWHYAGLHHLDRRAPVSTAGSRANGLHWAACWIEDRLAQTAPTDLHGVVRGVLREHAERVTAEAHRDMQRALGRDGRDTVLPSPCPWCGGELTARTTSGDPMAATVTCGTGPACPAPTVYDDRARRVWHGADLCGLYGALSAAQRRSTA